jgi:hypothetical protein
MNDAHSNHRANSETVKSRTAQCFLFAVIVRSEDAEEMVVDVIVAEVRKVRTAMWLCWESLDLFVGTKGKDVKNLMYSLETLNQSIRWAVAAQ